MRRIASMAQGYQICHCEERSDVAISQNPTGQQGSHRRNRNCLPEIAPQGHFLALRAQGATAPVGPRNDKLEGLAPQNACRKDCQPARRSLSAATDAISAHHFNGGLYELQVPSRDCHVGLRPPRNDCSGAVTILMVACTGCKCAAGPGCPLPYNARPKACVFFIFQSSVFIYFRAPPLQIGSHSTRSSLHTVSTWAQRGKRSTASACVRA